MINGFAEDGKRSNASKLANILHEKTLDIFELNKTQALNKIKTIIDGTKKFKESYDYDFDKSLVENAILNEGIYYFLDESSLEVLKTEPKPKPTRKFR